MTRGEFLKATGSIAIFAAAGDVLGSETVIGAKADYAALQAEIDDHASTTVFKTSVQSFSRSAVSHSMISLR